MSKFIEVAGYITYISTRSFALGSSKQSDTAGRGKICFMEWRD